VPYPNRSDYAVSKAGQRALVENLARFVGPEIQINAIAPGPVEGQRLKGKDGKAGPVRSSRQAHPREQASEPGARRRAEGARVRRSARRHPERARAQRPGVAAARFGVPEPLRQIAAKIGRGSRHRSEEATHSSSHFIMTRTMATRLIARLRNGCVILDRKAHARAEKWVLELPEPPEPFINTARIAVEAEKIRDGVLGMLHLNRMPTETDVALATVYFMADRAISGEPPSSRPVDFTRSARSRSASCSVEQSPSACGAWRARRSG
jgi:malonyl-CoA reductase/3-hydroxypropionate dehydrogenase (NADP+)